MKAFQIGIVRLFAGIFRRPNEASKKSANANLEDFDAFLHRIKANTGRMKS